MNTKHVKDVLHFEYRTKGDVSSQKWLEKDSLSFVFIIQVICCTLAILMETFQDFDMIYEMQKAGNYIPFSLGWAGRWLVEH